MSTRFGFHTGFETYRASRWVRSLEHVTRWLDEAPGRRSFLFLHTFEIHDPYAHSTLAEGLPAGRLEPGFSTRQWNALGKAGLTEQEQSYVEALYDSGIRYTDERLGRLFEELEQRGLLERTVVIVTSDHGEQFWEHGSWRHGSTMYDHQLRVPLIIHLPPPQLEQLGGPRVIAAQVRLVDLVPTILDLLDQPIPAAVQGSSLLPLLAGEETEERPAFAENTNVPRERKALRWRGLKLIHSFPKNPKARPWERFELYDLERDPLEQNNLADQRPELVAELKESIERLMAGGKGVEFDEEVPAAISPELRRELEALGYVAER